MNTLVTKVVDGVYYIGVNDRETALFENMWHIIPMLSLMKRLR